jgi:hypothetical protein
MEPVKVVISLREMSDLFTSACFSWRETPPGITYQPQIVGNPPGQIKSV